MGPPRISTTTRMVLAVFLAEPAAVKSSDVVYDG